MESYESKVKAAVTRLKFGIAHQTAKLRSELTSRQLGLSYGQTLCGRVAERSVRGCNYK